MMASGFTFSSFDSDSLMLSDIRELLYILAIDAADRNTHIDKRRIEFRNQRMEKKEV